MKLAIRIWKETFETLLKNPIILLPFLIVGLFDIVLLILIYLAPQPPFSALLAPPIRAFWGEQFLHYPVNLFLIPRLFNYGHIISTAVIGVLMTGLAIGMLKDAREGVRPGILFNLIKSIKAYLSLVVIWAVLFGLVTLIFKGLPFALQLKQRTALQVALYASFLISIFIEVIFIYAMPAVMIEKKRAWAAIKRSITFAKGIFLPTLFLVAIPMLIYIPMIALRGKLPVLMNKLFPEVVLISLGLGIIVSVITDCLITCSTAILFLNRRRG
ncbi:MAG: hypothetical protein KKH11_00960 [Candidatus Omnitrophica bacterium]|nr:hypothetical protein [Candidatus Omnitrophota bacterium]